MKLSNEMKKYLRILTVAFLVTSILFSCKKDSSTPKPTCRIITASGTVSGQTNFSYNSEGKLISISSGTVVTSLAYSGNTVIAISNKAGVFNKKKIITLNSNGLASNVRIENDLAGTNWENFAYEYSGTELIKDAYTSSVSGDPVVSAYTWSGGNLISNSGPAITATLEYYTDKISQAGDYLFLSQLQSGYQILRNKNAVKSYLSGSNILNFDYTIGADGKITSVIATGSSSSAFTYQYQCN
jgi:hypothetical protein